MQLDQNPFFRKAITPWYDSNPACWSLMVFLFIVLVFAVAGILVGSANPDFTPHVWFPALLGCLSLFLIIKIYFRVKRRDRNN